MGKPVRGPGRPKQYLTSLGQKVPGVTTILKQFKDDGAIIRWANRIGLEGTSIDDVTNPAKDKGRTLHDYIEQVLMDEQPDLGEEDPELASAVGAFKKFRDQFDGEILEMEIPLVSDRFRFGGTIDAVGTWRGKPIILDWKTCTPSIWKYRGYAEHIVQLGGYAQLWWENRQEVFDSAHVVYLVKKDEGMLWKTYDRQQLKLAHEQFLAFRECYERNRQLKDAI